MVGRSTPLMIRALTVSAVASLKLRSHFACDWSTSHISLHTACRASVARERKRKSVHCRPSLELWRSFRFELSILSSKPDLEDLPRSIAEPWCQVAGLPWERVARRKLPLAPSCQEWLFCSHHKPKIVNVVSNSAWERIFQRNVDFCRKLGNAPVLRSGTGSWVTNHPLRPVIWFGLRNFFFLI